jgi:hypothetical protein
MRLAEYRNHFFWAQDEGFSQVSIIECRFSFFTAPRWRKVAMSPSSYELSVLPRLRIFLATSFTDGINPCLILIR